MLQTLSLFNLKSKNIKKKKDLENIYIPISCLNEQKHSKLNLYLESIQTLATASKISLYMILRPHLFITRKIN